LREPDTRPFAGCCEKGLEHPVEGLFRDPFAGIGDGAHDVVAGRRRFGHPVGAASSTFAVRIVIVPPEGMASRALIARFKTTSSIWLGEHQGERIGELSFNPVRRADGTLEQRIHSTDEPIEIDRAAPGPPSGDPAAPKAFRASRESVLARPTPASSYSYPMASLMRADLRFLVELSGGHPLRLGLPAQPLQHDFPVPHNKAVGPQVADQCRDRTSSSW
jgi:hypothetical protein